MIQMNLFNNNELKTKKNRRKSLIRKVASIMMMNMKAGIRMTHSAIYTNSKDRDQTNPEK